MEFEEERTDRETIEDIILRYSNRGITFLRDYIADNCCVKAAKEILSWERGNVFLTTGFCVAGHAETDGPVGTAALALALKHLGFHPIIVTDDYCRDFFESEGIETIYLENEISEEELDYLIRQYHPKGMISIERCGKNENRLYTNMRGISISEYTAPIDMLFEQSFGKIPTIGVGDGGNEIGMGKIAGVIKRKLPLEPCVVSTDILVIASVSNWGAYGIVCALGGLSKKSLLPGFEWVKSYLLRTLELGSVDGVTQKNVLSVDGKSMEIELEILSSLKKIESRGAFA